MRIRQRLKDQYEGGEPSSSTAAVQPHEPAFEAEVKAPQAGGFVAEGDAVVQPFHLPRFEHGTYQPLASGLPAPGTSVEGKGVVGKIPDFGLGSSTAPATSSSLLEYDEAEMSLPDVAPLDDAVWDARPARPSGVPRTMLELAEEAAGMANGDPKEETEGEGGGEGEGDVKASLSTPKQNGSRRSEARSRRRASAAMTNGRGGKASGKAKAPGRGKGRRRSVRDDEEHMASESEAEVVESEDERAGVSSEDAGTRVVPLKRKRSAPTVPSIKSDRVLRTRTPKSAKQLEEEREAQTAYRRAIAE